MMNMLVTLATPCFRSGIKSMYEVAQDHLAASGVEPTPANRKTVVQELGQQVFTWTEGNLNDELTRFQSLTYGTNWNMVVGNAVLELSRQISPKLYRRFKTSELERPKARYFLHSVYKQLTETYVVKHPEATGTESEWGARIEEAIKFFIYHHVQQQSSGTNYAFETEVEAMPSERKTSVRRSDAKSSRRSESRTRHSDHAKTSSVRSRRHESKPSKVFLSEAQPLQVDAFVPYSATPLQVDAFLGPAHKPAVEEKPAAPAPAQAPASSLVISSAKTEQAPFAPRI